MTSDRSGVDDVAEARLRRLLGGPDTEWLRARVRRRLEQAEPVSGTVTRSPATPGEQDAVELLLGRRHRGGGSVSVRLDDLDAVVRRSGLHPGGLAAAVIDLTGPVTVRGELARQREDYWLEAFASLDRVVAGRPELAGWRDHLHRTGLVRRLAPRDGEAVALLADLAAVVDALPAEPQPIGRFAEAVLGSAHALDHGRPLSALVFGAARALGDVGDGRGEVWRRDVWSSVGLVRDELSSSVLALGLPGEPCTTTGRALGAMADAGEPTILTLRQLVRGMPAWDLTGSTVSVCENPVVVAEAAERLGPRSSPLVCVGGQPGAAAMALLRGLAGAGASLRYHGDFDWGGLRIANLLVERLGARPWRFDAHAYRAATADRRGGRELRGAPVEATWDADLAPRMQRTGRVVEEERVVADLVRDLDRGAP